MSSGAFRAAARQRPRPPVPAVQGAVEKQGRETVAAPRLAAVQTQELQAWLGDYAAGHQAGSPAPARFLVLLASHPPEMNGPNPPSVQVACQWPGPGRSEVNR